MRVRVCDSGNGTNTGNAGMPYGAGQQTGGVSQVSQAAPVPGVSLPGVQTLPHYLHNTYLVIYNRGAGEKLQRKRGTHAHDVSSRPIQMRHPASDHKRPVVQHLRATLPPQRLRTVTSAAWLKLAAPR